jgi:hypothetical protein
VDYAGRDAMRDPVKGFTEGFKRQHSVTEPIASDTWTFKGPKGKKRTARIEIGKPEQVPNDKKGDWFCPVFIEGWTGHVIPVMGVGPLDSLLNAISLLRSFHESIGWLQISQGSIRASRRRT